MLFSLIVHVLFMNTTTHVRNCWAQPINVVWSIMVHSPAWNAEGPNGHPSEYIYQGLTLRVNLNSPRPVKIPKNCFRPVKKYLNWSYRPSKHLEIFLLKSFPPRICPNVFEINDNKIYKDKCCGEFYAMFFLVMLKKKCRTSKYFAGPADARFYWAYMASIILS